MKKIVLILAVLFYNSCYIGQVSDSAVQTKLVKLSELLDQESLLISDLNNRLTKQNLIFNNQKAEIDRLSDENVKLMFLVDSLSAKINLNASNIILNSRELGLSIKDVDEKTEQKISKLNSHLEENLQYWIIGLIVTVFIIVALYIVIRKTIRSSNSNVEVKIRKSINSLEEESIKVDKKLVDLLETQLKVNQVKNKGSLNEENDHSLALKVADEIIRMQKNISRLDQDIKGLKPLLKGLERIQNNFASNGYEMINLLNKPYEDRMNVDVINFIEDEELNKGVKIISKVIKPQVNYQDKLIQRAQVEVTQN